MKKALYEAHKLEKGFCMIYDVTQKRSAPYLNRGRFDFLQTKRCSCTRVQFLKLCKTGKKAETDWIILLKSLHN